MAKNIFWKGYHGPEIFELIKRTWENNDLLILCPPAMKDVSYLGPFLPDRETVFYGFRDDEDKRITCLCRQEYPEKPVLGVFTTGTTRIQPRLVLYSKENIVASVESIYSLFNINDDTSIFCYPQPYHVFGLTLGYAASIIQGLKLICPNGKYNHEHHVKWCEIDTDTRHSMISLGTPTHFSDLADFVEKNKVCLTPSFGAIIGGALVDKSLWYRAKEKLFIEKPSVGYGCTEASPGISHLSPGVAPLEDGELGLPLKGVEVRLEINHGLEFSGKNLCLAIVDNGRLTFPRTFLIPDNIVARKDGSLLYKGRIDLFLNRGGVKFSLEHIESLIKAKFSVEVVCVTIPESRLGQELGIVISGKEDRRLSSNIFILLEDEMGCKFNNSYIVFVDKLPLNSSSKIDRKACQKLFVEKDLRSFFPIDVEKLQAGLPHRAPMLWINKVLWAEEGVGKSLVVLDKSAHYYNNGELRRSSFIEWMAQAYGFNTIAYEVYKNSDELKMPTKAFLAAVSKVNFNLTGFNTEDLKEVVVHTELKCKLDNLSLVEARVTPKDSEFVLANASLKLYME